MLPIIIRIFNIAWNRDSLIGECTQNNQRHIQVCMVNVTSDDDILFHPHLTTQYKNDPTHRSRSETADKRKCTGNVLPTHIYGLIKDCARGTWKSCSVYNICTCYGKKNNGGPMDHFPSGRNSPRWSLRCVMDAGGGFWTTSCQYESMPLSSHHMDTSKELGRSGTIWWYMSYTNKRGRDIGQHTI